MQNRLYVIIYFKHNRDVHFWTDSEKLFIANYIRMFYLVYVVFCRIDFFVELSHKIYSKQHKYIAGNINKNDENSFN